MQGGAAGGSAPPPPCSPGAMEPSVLPCAPEPRPSYEPIPAALCALGSVFGLVCACFGEQEGHRLGAETGYMGAHLGDMRGRAGGARGLIWATRLGDKVGGIAREYNWGNAAEAHWGI